MWVTEINDLECSSPAARRRRGWGLVVIGGVTGSVASCRLGSSGSQVGGLSLGVAGLEKRGREGGQIWPARDTRQGGGGRLGGRIFGLEEGGSLHQRRHGGAGGVGRTGRGQLQGVGRKSGLRPGGLSLLTSAGGADLVGGTKGSSLASRRVGLVTVVGGLRQCHGGACSSPAQGGPTSFFF
ncbi:hypothetical protein TIFTF001_030001 [Ficus carica]|uniref:Uncharacterized protein n=1 Tax=Ficus carica TaxID=3494 RepID=A0AA88DWT2_FICCA|nr:hypothetical protein TIFTF001_030001 [Ficus carica]